MGFSTIEGLKAAFLSNGCSDLLIKPLSAHQDNEKNQIYLGGSSEGGLTDALFSILPGEQSFRSSSSSTAKRDSDPKRLIIETKLNLFWLDEGKEPALAPNATIINYFQYPEIRLSGFLSGCSNPPDPLRRRNQQTYGRRFLVFGISNDDVFATVITESEHAFTNELLELPKWPSGNLFHQLKASSDSIDLINPDQLLEELRQLSGIPHQSRSLNSAGEIILSSAANHGGGYTLEALLGIRRNSSSSPDKYGIEIKTFTSPPITLMTTEPDFGYRYEVGKAEFLRKFGWPGARNDGSLRFNGKHNTLTTNRESCLSLKILNWDVETNLPNGNGSPDVVLINPITEEIAAGWSFKKLSASWSKKHAGGMYVHTKKTEASQTPMYQFGPDVHFGLGTSPIFFLSAISTGSVYLDPGDRMYESGSLKSRIQWRLLKPRAVTLRDALNSLYDKVTTYQI